MIAGVKWMTSMLSPGGERARLSILIFHRVLPAPDPLFPRAMDARVFDAACSWIAEGFSVLPLDEAVLRLKSGTLPARAACITFDDGYADNHDEALPILKRHDLRATFFVATGFLDGGRMWNDSLIEAFRRCTQATLDLSDLTDAAGTAFGTYELSSNQHRRAAIAGMLPRVKYLNPEDRLGFCDAVARRAGVQLPDNLMMSSDQVRALHRAGMQIGGHTVSHPILARLAPEAARSEIAEGKCRLEDIIGERLALFAYPNGKPEQDYQPAHAEMVRELGFDAAVSTVWGAAGPGSDLYALPRFTPWDRTRGRFLLRMARNLATR